MASSLSCVVWRLIEGSASAVSAVSAVPAAVAVVVVAAALSGCGPGWDDHLRKMGFRPKLVDETRFDGIEWIGWDN